MVISNKDRIIIRDLAKRVADIAALPEQKEKIRLWTDCNDLEPGRAMVFADPQNGWKELDEAWLKLECKDVSLHSFELFLRRKIIRYEHIPDDFPILNTFPIPVVVTGDSYDDYGFKLEVTRSNQESGAYHIEPAIKNEKDLAGLRFRPIQINHKGTEEKFEIVNDLFGDILKAYKIGRRAWRFGLTRVLIHMRGLDQMMLDIYDNPHIIHRLMEFLRDDFLREIDLFEKENAISLNSNPDNVTGSGGLSPTNDLPGKDFDGVVHAKNCICWGESQETVGIGPKQFEEFVLEYQLPLLKRFGLVDYGCCEQLDDKLDILINKIQNLRWISVSPWANREIAAEKIGKKYVYVYKPNPSYICSPNPDWEAAEHQIRETLKITKGCATHIVMKDTHTFCNEPNRITQWAEMASRIVKGMK